MSESQAVLPQSKPEARVFTWIATILASAYILFSGAMLYVSTPKFIDMYSSMGVDLPLTARIVFAVYRFAYPLLFGGATALIIAKQFYVRAKWVNLAITLGSALVVDIICRGTIWALYRPLLDLIEKLNK